MKNVSKAREIIKSSFYLSNRMEKMDTECAYYIDQMYATKNAMLRKAFAKMATIYFKRYQYYFKKCTENEPRKSIQAGA